MTKKQSGIKPGGVEEYIAHCPKDVQDKLENIRSAIRKVAPDAVETVSYFQIPGYSYDSDYTYNGMFAWFSFKKPHVRLHVIPPVVKDYGNELAGYKTTAAIVSFPADQNVPVGLVEKLVKASLEVMKEGSK